MDGRAGNDQRAEVLQRLTTALDDSTLPMDEYDRRVAAVGTASYTSELVAQLGDLPPQYGWHPHPVPTPIAPTGGTRSGRTALTLGIVSVLFSPCLAGAIAGVLAILYSRRGPVARGFSTAMTGRVLGIVGIALSAAAGFSLWYALTHRLGA